MKKTILLFIVTLCLSVLTYAQSWHRAYTSPFVPISSGYFIDQNNAWLVGSSSTVGIYKSTDGGLTWTNKHDPGDTISVAGNDVSFVNANTGFVCCNKGRILKTADGGNTWSAVNLPTAAYTTEKIHFFDANVGYALATGSTISVLYRTSNGGTSWDSLLGVNSVMLAMDFYSKTSGVVIGKGIVYYTTNGTDWKQGAITGWYPGYTRTDNWGVKFINSTTIVSCGWGSSAAGNQPSIFLKSTDGGVDWVQQIQPDQYKTYVNFYSLYFKDQLNGIAVGGSVYPGTVMLKTTDGGTSWLPLPCASGFSPSTIIGNGDKIIVAGGSGDVILSSDFGNTWTILNKHPLSTMSSINVVNNKIYSCGYGGVFFKSTNTGVTFHMNYIVAGNKSLWSKSLFFLDENLGYACSQRGQILKTTNGGSSWVQSVPDTNIITWNVNSIYFINQNVGFAAGNYGSQLDIIYKTTDGGTTWSTKINQAFQNLNGISFADDMHGAAVGNKSAILYTTDQGVTWKIATVNITDQLSIYSVNFYDGLNGLAVGSGIILKTTDGGATWNRIASSLYTGSATLYSVIHDASGIYIAGGKYVYKSTDAGNSWVSVMDTVVAASLSFTGNWVAIDKSGYIWVAGYGIMTNSPVTGINNESFEPNSFSLEQNYPNPFNPSTNIRFTLNKSGLVTLKLFDVLGREVRTIYNGERSAGQHVVNLNAASLASGIYLYTIQFDNKIITHKMTLLK
jgi:photosystem II stability/assembly factor-like uncharacterized protein